jgi:two-component system chemotaxis response regulator CheB
MRSKIRVLIVDDSALIRQILTRALSVDPRIEIVGSAKDGVEGIEKARELQPDVVTLDVEMPQLTGLEALPHILKHSDARVMMLTTLDDPDTTYTALSLGAVDFINKPKAGFATSIADLSELLLKKIKIAYRIDPEKAHAAAAASSGPEAAESTDGGEAPPEPTRPVPAASSCDRIVAIASSTGGPPALEKVFSGLTSDLPAAYLVVQHLPQGFSASLARRLDSVGGVEVREAAEGAYVEPGLALLAPYGAHMIIEHTPAGRSRIVLEDAPPTHGVRPAADPLFESVAESCGDRSVGVVLTGMGSDGARGLAAIKAAGGDTIVQNEETSVVWGMPGAAHKMGAVRHMVPIGLVAAEIRRTLRGKA